MIKLQVIGTLGADAELKVVEGSKFTTFRVAHNDSWTDQIGMEHTSTQWIDATLNDHPKVAEYLKRGTQVFIEGYPSFRVYSSPKDKCMKAGVTIRVQKIELLGGRVDEIPRQLFDESGVIYNVNKHYNIPPVEGMPTILIDKQGRHYGIDENGWVYPAPPEVEAKIMVGQGSSADGAQTTNVNPNGKKGNGKAQK